MAKRQIKRKKFQRPVQKPKPPVQTADAIVLVVVNVLGFLSATVAMGLSIWAGYDTVTHGFRSSIVLAIGSASWCLILWVALKLTERAQKILKEPLWEKSAKELKRIQILALSLQPLVLFTTALPLLYTYGYVSRFSNWMVELGITRKISENWLVGLSYLGSIVLSGIIGNASYALIKYGAKKLYKPDSRLGS